MEIDDASAKTGLLPSSPVESVALVATHNVPPASPASVEDLVASEFADAPVMVDIARAESHFDPAAKNPHSTATGVFQILVGTWNAYKCSGSRTNALDNIRCARKLYDDSGTTPWVSSSSNW